MQDSSTNFTYEDVAISDEPRFQDRFAPFEEMMVLDGVPKIARDTFKRYYQQLVEGRTGLIPEKTIRPVQTLPDAEDLTDRDAEKGKSVLNQSIYLKLNGGLGTSMGLSHAKSLLRIKEGYSFLDLTVRQALHLKVPLVLMNSFSTQHDTHKALLHYPSLKDQVVPLDFLQHKTPKILQSDFSPARWAEDPRLNWCPPGHGDIYTALLSSGLLDKLMSSGYRYAFVSNSDNLGASLDLRILGFFADQGFPFLMEAADRTAADRKGGHLAQRPDGQLILRELAQCPDEDLGLFLDHERHRFFNTNNLWVDLAALSKTMKKRQGILGLPMIRNRKTLDPRRSDSAPVYQLETAMGSAIAVFEGAAAIRVPRSRMSPVKTTNDLLAICSDAYQMTDDFRVTEDISTPTQPFISLDSEFYGLVDDMTARFPYGPPSLNACTKFKVQGDFLFGRDLTATGDVSLVNRSSKQVVIVDGTHLSGEYVYGK